jgi:hypothetical protein
MNKRNYNNFQSHLVVKIGNEQFIFIAKWHDRDKYIFYIPESPPVIYFYKRNKNNLIAENKIKTTYEIINGWYDENYWYREKNF